MKSKDTPRQSPLHSRLNTSTRTPGESLFENQKQLLSYKETARYLSMSEPYLRRLKAKGEIPFVPIGSRGVRFRIDSLIAWIKNRER